MAAWKVVSATGVRCEWVNADLEVKYFESLVD